MTVHEFLGIIEKLEAFYKKQLEQIEKDMWYNEFGNLTAKRFEEVLHKAYTTCKYMPKLADVVAINKELPYQQIKAKIEGNVECKKCKSIGLIFYKKIINNGPKKLIYDFAARCECENGLQYAYDGTNKSDTEHKSKYYIPTARQLGI